MPTFYTAISQPRPMRLSEAARQFAYESQQGRYGTETKQHMGVSMDDVEEFAALSPQEQYDRMIEKIAKEAPIRICEAERISGSATLGYAISCTIPATYQGQPLFHAGSHVTLGFERAVRLGIGAYQKDIANRLDDRTLSERQRTILISMLRCIDALDVWRRRYLDATKDVKPECYQNLLQVPFGPSRHFHEAVQSLWFLFAFTRLCGYFSGIGRIDVILGKYLTQDLEEGIITLDEAREILASFFIKGCEWIERDTPRATGDAQHYQNIVLSGVDEDGQDVTNEVTYLVLDIVEELNISDFPIAVRLREDSPARLFQRVGEVIRHGGGIVAVYNERLILNSMVKFGYSLQEARRFANDGCWEVQVPGKTNFCYIPFDSLQLLQKKTLGLDQETPNDYPSYEALYQHFKEDLRQLLEEIYRQRTEPFCRAGVFSEQAWQESEVPPCTILSLFTEDCIRRGRSYYSGGPAYTVVSPHIGGLADVANSLLVLKQFVFEEQRMKLTDFLNVVRANWEGEESLRQFIQTRYSYFGNDSDPVDEIAARVLDDFADIVLEWNGRSPILFPPGVSTFGRQIDWNPFRTASPHGKRKGDILAGNCSPTPGTDEKGATAIIRSYCKANLEKQTCGAALDIKLYPTTVEGSAGVEAIVGLINGFLALGGFFMQMDVIDNQILLDAKVHPEEYKSLAVRVSGWSARFVTLNEEWQDMIIQRDTTGM